MTDYAIWKPEHDGHAPPNWRDGMKWDCEPFNEDGPSEISIPSWYSGQKYKVPAEALNSPNDDWPTDKQLKLDNLAFALRQYPAEELAKHGITLAPERDWATELWAELFTIRGMTGFAKSIREGRIDDDDRAAIELLRTRIEQMIAERSKRDA